MSERRPYVTLRVWTPRDASVTFVRQVAPVITDLTGRRAEAGRAGRGPAGGGPRTGDYPTGAWAPGESRGYHIGVEVPPADTGRRMLAARISLVATSPSGPPEVLGQGLVPVTWTEDEAGTTDTARLLATAADAAEEATGTVRLKKPSEAADERPLVTRSVRTVRMKKR